METQDQLEKRIKKASFIIKMMLDRWSTMNESLVNTTTYKMTQEALDILEGRSENADGILPMNIDDDTFLTVAKMAHEKDITFNQMVEYAIRKQLDDPKIKHLLDQEN